MPRQARKKVISEESFYHCYNRIVGSPGDYPFTEEDKNMGFRILQECLQFFLHEPISVTFMGNHFHIIIYQDSLFNAPCNEAIAKRYNDYYAGRKPSISPDDDEACKQAAADMLDISKLLHMFQQRFAQHFNKRRNRKGHLWAGRFNNNILEGKNALWDCAMYVEMNSVRAGLAEHPREYAHTTLGQFAKNPEHPWKKFFIKHMRRWLGNSAQEWTPKQIMDRFITRLNDVIAKEKQAKASKHDSLGKEEKNTATNKPEPKERPLALQFLTRTRAWTEGVFIGSKQFVSRMASLFYSNKELRDRKFRRGNSSANEEICCFNQLRGKD